MSVKEFGLLQSTHPETMKVLTLAESIANSHVPVLIQGEAGTGKTALACEIAKRSGVFTEVRKIENVLSAQADKSGKKFTLLVEEIDKLNLDQQDQLIRLIEPLLLEKRIRVISTTEQNLKKLCL